MSDHPETGLTADFWSDVPCIQCRAEDVYANPSTHQARIAARETERYDIMRKRYSLMNDESLQATLQQSIMRAYRKSRLDLWGLINMPHECGKLSTRTHAEMHGMSSGSDMAVERDIATIVLATDFNA